MNFSELLRLCADKLDSEATFKDLILVWPHNQGRFPFLGKGVELLSATSQRNNYCVPVSRILTKIGKVLSV